MLDALNANAGALTAICTIILLLVTAFYAWTTYQLLRETKIARMYAGQPRIVAYLRINPVIGNIVQLHVANLSSAAATAVSAAIEKTTAWPEKFDLQDSKILRDISYMRPNEVIKLDLGLGHDLFKSGVAAEFRIKIKFSSTDGRDFLFDAPLRVESVEGFALWKIHSIDDVARCLKDIADTMKAFSGHRRLRVDTYSASDREEEQRSYEEMTRRRNQEKNHP